MSNLATRLKSTLQCLKVDLASVQGEDIYVTSPINGDTIATLHQHTSAEVDRIIDQAGVAFRAWRQVPPPVRGELVRLFGEKLREHKTALGTLVSIENGKILQEGLGEVQEMIDICDLAVGQSRQLYGLTIASERADHRMQETWHPIGPVGVISAFNFPVAVWSWNTALALVCGDSVVWKPSEKTPLTALACLSLLQQVANDFAGAPEHLVQVLLGDATVADQMVQDKRVPVISATGSCAMGEKVAPKVAARFGRAILELGGNNAITVCPSADMDMAVRAIVFGAVGTAGQRCTSTRRLFVHEDIYDNLVSRLKKAYAALPVGNPLEDGVLVGPLIDQRAFDAMQKELDRVRALGATVTGGSRFDCEGPAAFYANPALVEMPVSATNVQDETFAPILYIFRYTDLDDAIARNNDVPQGLSSSIFTTDMREANRFIAATGSDCGIANVNIGTSGAEIGGAFGGEKATGGGRESGSDAWKGYMRRSTSTINYGTELPLAQGIKFDI